MFRKAFCILSVSVILLLTAGCRSEQKLGDLDGEASDGVWRASSTASTRVLPTADYTVAKGFTDDVNQKLTSVTDGTLNLDALSLWKSMTDAMLNYDLEGDSLSEYVGALHETADCLYGFYLLNSTQAMMEDRLKNLAEAYSKIGKLEKTTIIPVADQYWITASTKFKEFGEAR